MNDFKPISIDPRERPEAKPGSEPSTGSRDLADLPISNWDDYKSWCEKVKENWDVN